MKANKNNKNLVNFAQLPQWFIGALGQRSDWRHANQTKQKHKI